MADDPKRPGLLPYLLLTGTTVCWGGTFVAAKFAVADLPPLTAAAARFVIAWVPLAALLVWGQRQSLRLSLREVWPFALLGITGPAIPNALLFTGLQYTSATNAALIQAGLPEMSALFAAAALGERLGLRQWVGILVSLLGVAYVVGEGSFGAILTLDLNRGNLMITGAVLSWSVNGVLSKLVLGRFSPLTVTTHTVFFGGLFLSALALTIGPAPATWSRPGWAAITAVLFLAVFGNVIGQVWWFAGMRAVGVSRSAVFANLMPLVGIGLAALILGEQIAWYHVVGTLAVIGGVTLTIWTPDLVAWSRQGLRPVAASAGKQDERCQT
ncbi:MAG: DMT family transporter [Chloroflexi bacterium]|nr:DMT family transporter [Chloroflexota bacterium]